MPHGYCYNWVPVLVWLHVISDGLIFAAYMSIPVTLARIVRKRSDIPFNWMFGYFGLFIVACGLTHFLEVWNLWHAMYWLAGSVKVLTAVASVATAILLVRLTPAALALPRFEELRTSEARFREILESAPDSIVVTDKRGRIVLANTETEKLFGYPREELMGKTVEILMPERFRGKHIGHRHNYAAQPQRRPMGAGLELFGRRKDGSEFSIEISLSPLRSPDGVLIACAIRDVTERKKSEEIFRIQNERLREQAELLELAHDAIIVRDIRSRIVFWNSGAERTYGWTPEEARGQVTHALLATVFPVALEETDAELLRTGIWEGELGHRRKDGSTIVVDSRQSLQRDAHGVPTAILEINNEITDRKQAEQSLRESEERSRLLVEGVEDYAIFMLDKSGRVSSWNAGAQRIKGYSAEEIVGAHLSKFYSPEDRAAGRPEQELEMAARTGRAEAEGWRIRKDGSRFWASVAMSSMRGADGELIGFTKFTVNATQRRERDERIRELNQDLMQRSSELETINRELESFSYSVSHDLRAPLRHIDGFARILIEEYSEALPPNAQGYLKKVLVGAEQMGRLVEDLLNLSRVGRAGVVKQETNLANLVESLVTDFSSDLNGRQISWHIETLPAVSCDPGLMRIVFTNLLSNALKFTSRCKNAEIEIGRRIVDGESQFFIRDNGVGFDPKYADRLFGVFQRLHRADEFEGTGVGLATVLRIIQKHGGRIWAESQANVGATFYFTLANVANEKACGDHALREAECLTNPTE